MAESSVPKTRRDGVTMFADNAGFGGGNTYTVTKEEGNLAINVPGRERLDFLDRGALVGDVRYGDDQAVNGSFTAFFRDATDASAETLTDLVNWSGHIASTWTSTGGANAEVPTVDMQHTIEGSDHGDGADHVILVEDVSFDWAFQESQQSTLQVNWRSHSMTNPDLT